MIGTQWERGRERGGDTEGEGEAGSMHQEPDVGLDPGYPGPCPGPKAGAKPLRHPGIRNLFFIGVQLTNIQNNTQCSSRQVSPSVPVTHSPPPPTSSPYSTPSSFPRVSSLYDLSPFLIFPTHFFSIPLYSLSLLFIFPKLMRTYILSFSDWLTSLSIIASSSIHVETNVGYFSFLMVEYYSIVYINHIFFIHSSFDGHRGYFHSLVIVDIAARNIGVQVSRRFIASEYLG